jgi:hypothetical protein
MVLRGLHRGSGAAATRLRARGPHVSGSRGGHDAGERGGRRSARGADGDRLRSRFLFEPAVQSRRLAPGLAGVGAIPTCRGTAPSCGPRTLAGTVGSCIRAWQAVRMPCLSEARRARLTRWYGSLWRRLTSRRSEWPRRLRSRGADARHAQIRVAIPRSTRRSVPRQAGCLLRTVPYPLRGQAVMPAYSLSGPRGPGGAAGPVTDDGRGRSGEGFARGPPRVRGRATWIP